MNVEENQKNDEKPIATRDDGYGPRRKEDEMETIATRNDLLTIAQIRREFFSPKNAPRKTEIERWIVAGTAEGVLLRGVKIDGKFFAGRRDVEIFLEKSRVDPARREPKRARDPDATNRVEEALRRVRSHGVRGV